jgi:small-conductance mechanosensitive channel
MLSHWWENVRSGPLFLAFLIAAMAIWAGLYYISFRRVVHLREWSDSDPPSEWRRAASAGRVILLRLLPIVAASAFLYFGLTASDLLSSTAARIILTGIASLVIIATVQGVTKTTLAITRPQWRLLNLSDRAARQLYKYLMILSVVYGADFFISAVSQAAFMPFSVNLGQSFVSSVLIAGLIISILRIKENGGDGATPRPIGRAYIRLPLWLIALTILGAAMIGYVSFARFIAGQLIVTSTILIVTYLLFISASAFGQGMSDEKSIMGARLRDDLGFDKSVRERLALPVMLILKAAIIIAAVPLVLLLWGFDWYDIGSWLRQALFGFEIGGVTLSITSVLIAMLLFIVGYIAARFFQDWLDGSVLKTAGVDPGVRDSVRTGVGYLGVGLAALLAVSYLGLSFSNIAIVAGALSVGIGFGLQSIVNNFVSGLILLAERPIKSGDWIIVGSHEGIVRKISVRSTEIETFDRANVIVPNSMLISDTVKNWTLHNSTGRMPIPVGVHYDSDPERVREILLGVARDHPAVLSNPAPFVFFEGFGDSALNFILFVYLSNVNQSFSVRTDLRIAILKAFRQHGVEIPYPQTDVHLRDLDWVKEALKNRRIGRDDGADVKRRDYKAESQEPDTDAADSDGQ